MHHRKLVQNLPKAEEIRKNKEITFPIFYSVSDIEHYNQEMIKLKLLLEKEEKDALDEKSVQAIKKERAELTQQFEKLALLHAKEFIRLAGTWHIGNPASPKWKQSYYSAVVLLQGAYQLYADGPDKARIALQLSKLKEVEKKWGHQMLETDSASRYMNQSNEQIKQLQHYAYKHGNNETQFKAAVSLLEHSTDKQETEQLATSVITYCQSTSLQEEKGKEAAQTLREAKPIVIYAIRDHVIDNVPSLAPEIVNNSNNVLGKVLVPKKNIFDKFIEKILNEKDPLQELARPGALQKRNIKREDQVNKAKAELLTGSAQGAVVNLFRSSFEIGRDTIRIYSDAIDQMSENAVLAKQFLEKCKNKFRFLDLNINYTHANEITETTVLAKAAYHLAAGGSQEKATAAFLYARALEMASHHVNEKPSNKQLKSLYKEAFDHGIEELAAAIKLCNLNEINDAYLDKIINSAYQNAGIKEIKLNEKTKDAIAARIKVKINDKSLDPLFLSDKKNPLIRALNEHPPEEVMKNIFGPPTERMTDLLRHAESSNKDPSRRIQLK